MATNTERYEWTHAAHAGVPTLCDHAMANNGKVPVGLTGPAFRFVAKLTQNGGMHLADTLHN